MDLQIKFEIELGFLQSHTTLFLCTEEYQCPLFCILLLSDLTIEPTKENYVDYQ